MEQLDRMTRDQSASFLHQSFPMSPSNESKPFQSLLESPDPMASFMAESQMRFNQFLEERGFSPIPPPAGFGTPTRPSFTPPSSQSPVKSHTDLPLSPLSPPSPFQHPFFKRHTGPRPDPWARFSGFGLTPLINQRRELFDKRFSQTFDLHTRKSDSNILEGQNIRIRHIRTSSADGFESEGRGGEEGEEVLVIEKHQDNDRNNFHMASVMSCSGYGSELAPQG